MNSLSPLKTWIKNNLLAILISGLFISIGFARFLPLNANWVVWQTSFTALGQLVLGLIDIPIRILIALASGMTEDWITIYILDISLLALVGIALGTLIQISWKVNRRATLYALILIIWINAWYGVCEVVCGDIVIGPVEQVCEQFIPAKKGIRVVSHSEIGILAGTHFFFLNTNDGGKSWQQFEHIRWDDQAKLGCENIGFVAKKSTWEWRVQISYSSIIVYTEDEGNSWRILER
jgi:hypothetical protein